jgi:hypothetical protein
VTFTESGGEDENSFHDSLGQHRSDSSWSAWKFNGYFRSAK